MPGPDYYNNWVKEKPVTTNQTYGFFMRGEMAARRAANCEAQLRLSRSQDCLNAGSGGGKKMSALMSRLDSCSSSSRLPRITSSRHVGYYIAAPLPREYSRNARPATAGQSVYLWNTLSGCTVKANM